MIGVIVCLSRIVVEGWETFGQHPDLILFEGYLTKANEAHLERKRF